MKAYFSHDEGARNDPNSTSRTAKGGCVNSTDLPRGENNRALCRHCSQEVPVGRRSFCSESCIHDWKMKTSSAYARDQVFCRDRGVCCSCKVDTLALKQEFAEYQHEHREADRAAAVTNGLRTVAQMTQQQRKTVLALQQQRDQAWCADKGIAKGDVYKAWWQADHIVPVAEGGGGCGLDNYQTLCLKCHKAKTAEQARRRGLAKRKTPHTNG